MIFTNPDPKDRGWRGAPLHWQIAHVVGIVLPALIFWFVPEDVLTRYPALASITGIIKNWIPSVRNMAEFSTFPQVAELGMSAIFVCSLLLVPVFLFGKTMAASRRKGHAFPTDSKQMRKVYLVLLFVPICIVGALLYGPDTPAEAAELLAHRGGRIQRMTVGIFLDSRFWSGFMASLLSTSLAVAIQFGVLFIRHIMGNLKRKAE